MPQLARPPSRPYRTVIMDSRRWNGFVPRDGDIVVATYPKCGTTWTQRIVDMLIHQSTAARPVMDVYPWLDATIFAPVGDNLATLAAQTHRRAIKSHLPFDSLPVYDGLKYIHVARDGRDACMSFHNHMTAFTEHAAMQLGAAMGELMAEAGPAAGPPPESPPLPPEDPRDFYLGWIDEAEHGARPGGDVSFFDFELTYWQERRRPNLLLTHYNDLKADLAGEIARISDFLEIATPKDKLAEITLAAEFSAMKSQGDDLMGHAGLFFEGGANRFLHKGTNGRWKDVLTADDLARYDAMVAAKFSPGMAAWIETGRLSAGDPRNLPD